MDMTPFGARVLEGVGLGQSDAIIVFLIKLKQGTKLTVGIPW